MWSITPSDTGSYLWHLKKIEAEKAWDITKGSQDIQVAVIDTWFDINHPDLEEKFTTFSDPMSSVQFSSNCLANHHGTAVSSCVAAHTDGGGQMSSIGFNTMIIPYNWNNGLAKALHASNVEGADIISISWFNSCTRDNSGQDSLIIKEILDNGTIIVAAAGNGFMAARCPSSNFPPFSPVFPFSPTYDNRLICVSSTDRHDNHSFFVDGEDETHSHFPEVDICAPGYRVMVATSTLEEENGICVTNAWPYSGWGTGTSFATPIVAGVCALMKSVNPCLTPTQAKSLIKSTADPIADAHLYPGMVGTGRVNAYKAVKAAGTRSLAFTTLSGNQTYGAGYALNIAYTSIGSSSNITLTARNEVNISMSFSMPLGSTLDIMVDPDAVNTCN